MDKMLILTADSNGGYPVPAVNGGAVSELVESLARDNERSPSYDLYIMSLYSANAFKEAQKYKRTKFIWIKIPKIIKVLDNAIFSCVKKLFPRKKSMSYKSLASLLFYIIRARIHLRNNAYDKLIIENNILLSLVFKFKKMDKNQKYYYHLHNVPRINGGCKKIVQGAKNIICVSDFVGDEIEKESNPIGPIKKNKVVTLRNCVDMSVFNSQRDELVIDNLYKRLNISKKTRIILFAGRISREKGIDKLLTAVSYLPSGSNVKVLIVGGYIHGMSLSTKYQGYLMELSAKLGIDVEFTGYIEQRFLKYYYQIADISILPSMWDEPAGLTMLESMACGTPVITTYSGGIPEYVKNGAIVLKRNKELSHNIANSIELLLGNERLYNEYVQLGIRLIRENYSSEGYMKRLRGLIG